MGFRHVRLAATAVLAAGITSVAGTWSAGAQLGPSNPPITLLPPPPSTTTTAPPPPTTPPPAPTPTQPPGDGTGGPTTGPTAPIAAEPPPADGDGAVPPPGRVVPPDAQHAINAIARTAPNDNDALVAGAAALEAAGLPEAEAVRLVYGRFPVLGPTRWVDDWYFPRWTGATFRHHLGLDMFAAYGTPVAAPVDGVVRIATNALGGLTIRVVEPDGTFWYLAHLSGIAQGINDGSVVTVGQVVGFVGDSGNARGGAPHLHFALHPQGGGPVPPKPHVDQWVADGAARVPGLLAGLSATPQSAAELATDLTRELATGPTHVGAAAAAVNGTTLDWAQRAALPRALDEAWARATAVATTTLGPLTSSALRQATEARRTAAAALSP
jgi:murein DD-endopeptidase MepM/ murein hydrolase activator NlpD